MHSKKIIKHQLGSSQPSLSALVFSEQLQVGVGYSLSEHSTTLGGKLFQATTTGKTTTELLNEYRRKAVSPWRGISFDFPYGFKDSLC